jgi:histidinol-phosphate aminotransferase
MSIESLVKPYVAKLEPYQPGKPVEELERELGISGAIKLASNENPLGPSPKAVEALRAALGEVHRYPDGSSFRLRRKLAARLGVEPGALVFGTGSDGILEFLAKAFLAPGDEAVFAWPSFAMYPIVVGGSGARAVSVPLDEGLVHDLPAMSRAIGERTRLVIVCNPNNPTGTSVGAAAFERFVEALPADVVLAVDEAYVEYVRRPDFPDALAWVRRRPGTIVLRTFSKIYGLAGLRVGYGIGDPELVGFLERTRHPFDVSSLAQVAAEAALDDDDHVARSRRANAEGMEWLARELASLGIETWSSDANFLLARAGGRATYDALLREGVIVRPLGGFGLTEHVRITVGLPEENARLVAALRKIRAEAKP